MGWDNDLKRLGKDPLGATTSIATDPYDRFNANGKTTMTLGGAALEGAKDKPIDQLTLKDIQAFMASGRARGEEMTGVSSKNVGKKRGEIRGQYEDIVNGPSRGASRAASARNADLKSLRQSQGAQGVSGGMARLQQNQMNQDYAGKIGDVRQKEYLDALNKLETQYRGAASDIMTTEGQYGAIGVGSKPNPTMSDGGGLMSGLTYICSELSRRGFVSKWELFCIHALLVFGTFYKPAQTLFYLRYGDWLVAKMIVAKTNWNAVKIGLFDISFALLKQGKLKDAVNHYEKVTTSLFLLHGFEKEVEALDYGWSLKKVWLSLHRLWRLA